MKATVSTATCAHIWLHCANALCRLIVERAVRPCRALALLVQIPALCLALGLAVRLDQQQSRPYLHTATTCRRARRPVGPRRHGTARVGNLEVGDEALGLHALLLLH
jgi:hypothetical protein